MPTTLLYHTDPHLLSFQATVMAWGKRGERDTVVLDQTAFYPEAGGQMADRGTLAGLAIADVQVDDDGAVHHVLTGALPAVGAVVAGEVDRARRRLFMALHTAQHMLSRALVDVARAETVSARLGETACTIDVDVPGLADDKLVKAEALTQGVVDDDVPVRAYFPTPAELAALPLRRRPKVDDNVRVIEIGGYDVSPCGGTHCTSTAQVGVVRVTGVERYKGKMRVSFSAGPRAREELFTEVKVLGGLAAALTCGPLDVGAAFERLRRDVAALRGQNKLMGERVAVTLADELLAQAKDGVVVAVLPFGDKELLKAVAARLTARDDVTALLAVNDGDGVAILAARGAKSAFDCGALVKRVTTSTGGRGGGKPERAEGRIPPGADWATLARGA